MDLRFQMTLLLALCACERVERVELHPEVRLVAKSTQPTCSPFGVDCCDDGVRVTSTSCVNEVPTCERGSICSCGGVEQSFNCVNFCGTDAFTGPSCVNGEWRCDDGLISSSTCPDNTCWGEPGDCCKQPRCEAGQWQCAAIEC